MNKKIVAVWASFIVVLGFIVVIDVTMDISFNVEGTTLYVNTTGSGGAYTSIQDAINAAKPGDTVFVYNGTYYENVDVNKTINLTGENKSFTVIDGSSGLFLDVVQVSASWVNITGFTITGNPMNFGWGIMISSPSCNNNISNNIIFNNDGGIVLMSSWNNTITDNNITDNFWDGIQISSSSNNNTIQDNYFSNNTGNGIRLSSSVNNSIKKNAFNHNGIFIRGDWVSHFNSHNITDDNLINGRSLIYYMDIDGIEIDGSSMEIGELICANCSDVNVRNLEINYTDVGVEFAYTSNFTITESNLSSNDGPGIHLFRSWFGTISENDIWDNENGIDLEESKNIVITGNNLFSNWERGGVSFDFSSYNTITTNNIYGNHGGGIYFGSSYNNTIINNKISNNQQDGIFAQSNSNNNTISGNNFSFNSGRAIYFILASNITITNNIIFENDYGIHLSFSTVDNRVYHNNFINNTDQAGDKGINFWDNGYPLGGNYWSDFDEPGEGAYDDYYGSNQDLMGPDWIVDNGTSGGGGKNPYVVESDAKDNYPLIMPSYHYIILKNGWNLISIPLIQDEVDFKKVLDSIEGDYDALQWYNNTDKNDHWKHNRLGKPFGNDLFHLNETMSFWIHITQPGVTIFHYNGTRPTSDQSITLHPGWNMVGFPSLESFNRTAGLNNITFGQEVDLIQWYDASTQTWHDLSENDYFELGRGYWVHANVKCEWEVPL
ncbi:MAG: right-handed parallel beta-helix repeat-containing protein [Thermoplasmata archaeon]|nr:MAG: right-handed parallel beta-helix repeat-containing protein [Thermoplasmata archaeon]